MSEFLNKQTNSNLLHFTSNLLQFDLLNSPISQNISNKGAVAFNTSNYFANLKLLGMQENSFFWFIKRAYTFTGLPSNNGNSAVIQNDQKSLENFSYQIPNFGKYNNFLDHVSRSNIIALEPFTVNNFKTSFEITKFSKNSARASYLIFNSEDLLSSPISNSLMWITAPISPNLTSPTLGYFSYSKYEKINYLGDKVTLKKCSPLQLQKINQSFASAVSSNKNKHLNDLHFFSLF